MHKSVSVAVPAAAAAAAAAPAPAPAPAAAAPAPAAAAAPAASAPAANLAPVCVTGVLGAYAYWGPKAGSKVFSLAPAGADLKFGAVTVATGVVGTILGGVALDRVGSTMANALAICCISNVLG